MHATHGAIEGVMTLCTSISEGVTAITGKTAAKTSGTTIINSVSAILPTIPVTRLAGIILISVSATIVESLLNVRGTTHLTVTAAIFLTIPFANIAATTAVSIAAMP
jgi:hypothetical protein